MSHFNCERNCTHQPPATTPEFIVLTGGPGAGKTAVLESVRKLFCHHVAILPEAAGILFSGGFWRLDSVSARKSAQRAIYHVQNELQQLVIKENTWAVGLCDRGTLDGLAYWPNSDISFFESLKTTRDSEYAKYKAVIHLRSPGDDQGYNLQNPLRVESALVAREIDERIYEAWRHHPNYFVIDSTATFIEKIYDTTRKLLELLPDSCRMQDVDSQL